MFRGNISRRGFLQSSSLALAAAGLPPWFAREVVAAEEEKKNEKADDTIKVGIIGIGSNGKGSKGSQAQSRARQLIHDVNNLNRKNIRFVAACDVDARHLEEGIADFKRMGHDAKPYKDFRDLTRNKDVDVVFVATPDQWHALCAIDAMKQGKHVYCEKPLTLTVAEAEAIVKVQQATGRVFQTGNQQRSDYGGKFRLACDLVRNGRIGTVKRIEARINTNPTSEPIPVVTPPAELDWDFWLGPTAKVDYLAGMQKGGFKTNCHYDFRWWYQFSGGKMTDWGAHHLDIGQWALNKDFDGPVEVSGSGSPPPKDPHSYSCHEHFQVTYKYAEGASMVATSEGENGVKFEGEDGKWLFVSRGKLTASDEAIVKEPLPEHAPRLPVSGGHMFNFFDCVKTGKKPICQAGVGASSVIICHIGVIALRLGKTLKWDPKGHKFDNDEANALLSRPYRKPWKLEI